MDGLDKQGLGAAEAYSALQAKLEELDAYTHQVLHQFPRIERHLLCADMRTAMNRMQRLLATAWKRKQKAAALFDMDVEVEVFRVQVRKACSGQSDGRHGTPACQRLHCVHKALQRQDNHGQRLARAGRHGRQTFAVAPTATCARAGA